MVCVRNVELSSFVTIAYPSLNICRHTDLQTGETDKPVLPGSLPASTGSGEKSHTWHVSCALLMSQPEERKSQDERSADYIYTNE